MTRGSKTKNSPFASHSDLSIKNMVISNVDLLRGKSTQICRLHSAATHALDWPNMDFPWWVGGLNNFVLGIALFNYSFACHPIATPLLKSAPFVMHPIAFCCTSLFRFDFHGGWKAEAYLRGSWPHSAGRPQRVPEGTRLLDFQITTCTLLENFYYSTEYPSSNNVHLFLSKSFKYPEKVEIWHLCDGLVYHPQ